MALSKTEKLYLDDPYTSAFRAQIISCEPAVETGRIAAVLDRSYFFPESGGQLADRGSINGMPVVNVAENADGVVFHDIQGSPDDVSRLKGADADCRVDWETRFDHMQQHTGQHVLSRAFIEVAGLQTVSFHMGEEACTIDLEGGRFSEEAVADAENLANSVVQDNRPVIFRTVSAADLEKYDLRKTVPGDLTEVRVVEVADFDVSACCGTHVRGTGELGMVKVLKGENVKGTRRVYFKVGRRAVQDYRSKHEITQQLANRLTTSVEGITAKIDKLAAERQRSRKDLKRLTERLASFEKEVMIKSAIDCNGVKLIVRHLPDGDDGYLRALSAELKSERSTVTIIGSGSGLVVCSASDDVALDFSRSAVAMANAVGGSGGGKGAFVQLKLPDGVDVGDFLKKVGDNVKTNL